MTSWNDVHGFPEAKSDLREQVARIIYPCAPTAILSDIDRMMRNGALAKADAILALVRANLTSDAAVKRASVTWHRLERLDGDYRDDMRAAILAALDGEGGT